MDFSTARTRQHPTCSAPPTTVLATSQTWSTSALSQAASARSGNGVYSLTKHGVGAFSESLRQELTKRYVRISLVEPGATATELASHNRAEVLESIKSQFGQTMAAEDIADAITYIVTRPRTVTINEILIRPTEQER